MFVVTRLIVFFLSGALAAVSAQAHQHSVRVSETAQKRCFQGNGLPDHSTGTFPNRSNPNRIQAQQVSLCVERYPVKGTRADLSHRGSVGIALNGVQIRPGTAEYYDPLSPRGFSKDASSGWNLEGIGAAEQLGMDAHLAHVDKRGLYHYHGVAGGTRHAGQLLGYAADGFKIYYATASHTSSYQLKSGLRPSGPGGRYDGTYVQDWKYAAGTGSLDRCNGATYKGEYTYFATNEYPFFPRCFWGVVSPDFKTRERGAAGGRRTPSQAIDACRAKHVQDRCQFTSPKGRMIQGVCRAREGNALSCAPNKR